MSKFIKTEFEVKHLFDPNTKRHFLNGAQSVYHCHHYMVAYTQLAIDSDETDLLQEVSEDTFYKVLVDYFKSNNIESLEDRVEIACQYYSAVGLGKLELQFLGEDSGRAISKYSHVEQGWIAKWGEYDKPVNYIGLGFMVALMAAVQGKAKGSYQAIEQSSIVMGDSETVFNSYKK